MRAHVSAVDECGYGVVLRDEERQEGRQWKNLGSEERRDSLRRLLFSGIYCSLREQED